MKIAQISPLMESVPPRLYGGTERIVSYLTEELVRQGHEVVLFASADSKTSAELVPCCDEALRLNPRMYSPIPYHMLMMELVRRRAPEFDLLHFHIDFFHFPLMRALDLPNVTTAHGRLDRHDLPPFFEEFSDMPLVSISRNQQSQLEANWAATIYHGLPADLYAFRAQTKPGYLAFLGRISPEKRPDRAIEIARRAGMELKIAAKVDKADEEYFETMIKPLLNQPHVEFIGEISEGEKGEFLSNAGALLFPIDWPEPFGLVMIEAMACGTPVVAWRNGSVPEVIDDGVTGFIVDSLDGAVEAVGEAMALERRKVRARFDERFTVERMARDYVGLYEALARKEMTLTAA